MVAIPKVRGSMAAAITAIVMFSLVPVQAFAQSDEAFSCGTAVPAASSYVSAALVVMLVMGGMVVLRRRRNVVAAVALAVLGPLVLMATPQPGLGDRASAAEPPCVFPVKENFVRRADNVFRMTTGLKGDANTTYKIEVSLLNNTGAQVMAWTEVAQRTGPGNVSGNVRLPAALQDGQTYVWLVRAVEVGGAGLASGAARGGRIAINEKTPDLYLAAGQVYNAGLEQALVDEGFQILTVRADPGGIVDVEKWDNNLGIEFSARAAPAQPKTAAVTYTTQKDANPPGALTYKVTVHD